MASLVKAIEEHAASRAGATACVIGPQRRSYGELGDQILRFASALRQLGFRPGDRLSLYLPNGVEYVICFYGAMRAGLVANLINGAFTRAEVHYLLSDSGAAGIVSTPELLARIGIADEEPGAEQIGGGPASRLRVVISTGSARPPWHSLASLLASPPDPVPMPPDDAPACLPYSSGTTGRSKGIVHTHDSLGMQAELSANHLQLRADDVLVQALPLVHLYPGNIIMGGLFVAGATMVVQPAFDPPAFPALLAGHHATACAGVPTTYAMLCQLPEEHTSGLDLGQLGIAFSAGAPLPGSIRSAFRSRFGADVLNCYGITEAAGNLVANLRYGDRPDLSCGVPYPLTEVRIVDPEGSDVPAGGIGELIARGPQIMTGYWNRPDATRTTLADGWLHTGDLARQDDRGFYFIVDRTKDLILCGGYNVYPAEVEEVLQSHPSVAMCAVFAVPDEIKGEKPWAAVVPGLGEQIDVAALDSHCRESLASYKVPRRFVVVDDLPRSSVGKILRRELRARYAPEAQQPSAAAPAAAPATAKENA
jgi:long-chain acyl-CoA synthetase